jgi:hypothetical protein
MSVVSTTCSLAKLIFDASCHTAAPDGPTAQLLSAPYRFQVSRPAQVAPQRAFRDPVHLGDLVGLQSALRHVLAGRLSLLWRHSTLVCRPSAERCGDAWQNKAMVALSAMLSAAPT